MTALELTTKLTTLDHRELANPPVPGHVMTALLEIPPGHPGTPPHRHSGPVFGYLLEGEMIYELEGEAARIIRPGEAFWEPGGDRIHYRAANNLTDAWTRFLAVMICVPGQPMLSMVSPDELESRRDRRHPGPVLDPKAT